MGYTDTQLRVCKDHDILILSTETFVNELRKGAIQCKQDLQDRPHTTITLSEQRQEQPLGRGNCARHFCGGAYATSLAS